jgi:hypothetical protein
MWGNLLHSVKTGESARKLVGRRDCFDDLAHDEQAALVFNRAMAELTSLVTNEVVRLYRFDGMRRVVDVGATVKPVAMIADAMKDCTRRNAIVLDTFCGSGATLLAAERVGRRGYGLEINPGYVDVAVRRWQAFSGKDALQVASGLTFEEIGLQRVGQNAASRTSVVDKGGRR